MSNSQLQGTPAVIQCTRPLSPAQIRAGLFAMEKAKNPTAPYPSPDPSVDYGFAAFDAKENTFEWYSMNATTDPYERENAFEFAWIIRKSIDDGFIMSSAALVARDSNCMPTVDLRFIETWDARLNERRNGDDGRHHRCVLGFGQFIWMEKRIEDHPVCSLETAGASNRGKPPFSYNSAAEFIWAGQEVLGVEPEVLDNLPGSDLMESLKTIQSVLLMHDSRQHWEQMMKRRERPAMEKALERAPALEVT